MSDRLHVIIEPTNLTIEEWDIITEDIWEAYYYGKTSGVWVGVRLKGFDHKGKPIYERIEDDTERLRIAV